MSRLIIKTCHSQYSLALAQKSELSLND